MNIGDPCPICRRRTFPHCPHHAACLWWECTPCDTYGDSRRWYQRTAPRK